MTLESLLLSRDVELVRIIRPTLEKLAIQVEICEEAKKASELLIAEKFDAVIVDCDDLKGGLEVMKGLRSTPSNRSSVAFAVLNGKKTTTQEAFAMGVNFVLQKPISMLNASRCFNTALNFMVRERRRYYRQPVKMPVSVLLEEKRVKAVSTNISEGGMAVVSRQALPKDGRPRLQFMLPETKVGLEIESEVAWADIKGHVGLRFHNVPQSSQELLEKWIDQQMGKERRTSEDDAESPGNEAVQ